MRLPALLFLLTAAGCQPAATHPITPVAVHARAATEGTVTFAGACAETSFALEWRTSADAMQLHFGHSTRSYGPGDPFYRDLFVTDAPTMVYATCGAEGGVRLQVVSVREAAGQAAIVRGFLQFTSEAELAGYQGPDVEPDAAILPDQPPRS